MFRTFTPFVVLVVAVAIVAAVAPRPIRGGGAWPQPIRIYNATGWQHSVAAAIGAWNRSGAHVHLILVRRAADADVTVVASDRALAHACLPERDCGAFAWPIGYWHLPRGTARIYLPDAPAHEPKDDADAAIVAAHEIAHILGLRHRKGCSIMTVAALEESCAAKELWPSSETFLCGPMPVDVEDASALYGGHLARGYRPVCPSGSN